MMYFNFEENVENFSYENDETHEAENDILIHIFFAKNFFFQTIDLPTVLSLKKTSFITNLPCSRKETTVVPITELRIRIIQDSLLSTTVYICFKWSFILCSF